MTWLPSDVRARIDGYLGAVDEAVPGLIRGFYVTGSVALGDYQPAISDIDAVALCRDRPDARQCEALAEIHAAGHEIDVLYATAGDLATDPRTLSLPCWRGEFHPASAFAANPVEWRSLATKAVAVRGGPPDPAAIWFDAEALRHWNRANLDDYWVAKTAEAERVPPQFWARWEYGLQWVVLGIPRLQHTIATLDVISKSAAGAYALSFVDERWHDVIRAAIDLRADRQADIPKPAEELVVDALAFARWLIADARRLGGG